MRIAISGKGGVGKTTLAGMLAGTLALKGRNVIALDADPDANLGSALGLSPEEEVTPLSEMQDLIRQRTGSEDDYGSYFKLNPKVDDIPDMYAKRIGSIELLTLGGIKKGGQGCICPATALVKALLTHLILGRDDAVIMDMEAGLEHLGRATAQSMDALLIVVTKSSWSIRTALRLGKLAGDIGLEKLFAVANLVSESTDLKQIRDQLGDIPLIGRLPYDSSVAEGLLRIDANDELSPAAALQNHTPAMEQILAQLAGSE